LQQYPVCALCREARDVSVGKSNKSALSLTTHNNEPLLRDSLKKAPRLRGVKKSI
jgi:hypothetical protein